jgi:quinol-cytochrome oxidoreductase complex cytochrome b subunit
MKPLGNDEMKTARASSSSFDALTFSIWGMFILTVLSGVFLMVYYVPVFSQAFSSVQRVSEQVPFGWMIRRFHAVGANLLLLLVFIHLLRVFYAGRYKSRPPSVWLLEILLIFCAVGANFTGFFLPLSQKAYWGTSITLSSLSTIPGWGNSLVEFLRGGRELGGGALTRFSSMHVGTAALMLLSFLLHQRRSMASPGVQGDESTGRGFWVAAVVAGVLLAVVAFFPYGFTDPLRAAANPTASPQGVTAPWYFLFLPEALSSFASAYPVGLTLFLLAVFLLVLFLPYLDRNPEKNLLLRPVSLSLGSGLMLLGIYFTLVGFTGVNYGQNVIVPDRPLSPMEVRGAQVFVEKNCAYCHQVFGEGGRREGPDMTVVVQRNRSPEWIQRFIVNARLYQPGTTMPRYDLPLSDVEALRAYLLSLDRQRETFRAVDRQRLLDFGSSLTISRGEEK